MFGKVGAWLTEKSDRFIRGGAEMPNGYYGSREAEQAYSSMGAEQREPEVQENGEETARRSTAGSFGHGGDEYGGRVPYRSRVDMERDARRQAVEQQTSSNAQGVQRPMQQQGVQGVPVRQQPMMQQPMAQQQPAQQPQMEQSAAGYSQQEYQQQQGYQQAGYQQQPSNVVPFPGMQRGPNGSVYAHVEYVVLLRSRNECKDVIGYIKSNASVFLNMEFIASDNERQRCVDMLSGAAYTLGCALNKISPRGIYLISSPTVRVVLDSAIQKFTSVPEAQGFARQRYDAAESYGGGYRQEPEPQQPISGFSSGSPTSRFQMQGTQRMPPVSFGSAMAGNMTGSYPAANAQR
ncbi:MAG: cell division protein SepF [Clostridia bacterium]